MRKEKVVIIGSGVAGLTAAIYLGRAGYKAVIIAGDSKGGQTAQTHEVENYPGFENVISGFDLMETTEKQAVKFGAEIVYDKVVDVDFTDDKNKKLMLQNGEDIQADAVIIASGCSARKIGIPSEKQYAGKGVSYCAVCDGFFYRNREIAIIGGGNTAVYEALYLSKICKKVTLIHRSETFRAEKVLLDDFDSRENIVKITNSVIEEFVGDEKGLTGIKIKNKSGEESLLNVEGAFVAIGKTPNTKFLEEKLELENGGYIKVAHPSAHTDVAGVFACGDVAHIHHQIVIAAGTGSVAGIEAQEYLQKLS